MRQFNADICPFCGEDCNPNGERDYCNATGKTFPIVAFATIEQARTVYRDACEALHQARMAESQHTRFGVCHDYGQGLVQKTIDANTALQAIVRDAIEQFGDIENSRYGSTGKVCVTCLHQSVFPGGPRHNASATCESGKHPHCTCDTCF